MKEMKSGKPDSLIGAAAVVKVENDMYFHESYGNRIFQYSMETEELKCIARSMVGIEQRLGYMGTTFYDGKVFFFPYYMKKICIYDIRNNSCTYKECRYQYITKAVNFDGVIFFWANEQDCVAYYDINKDIFGEIKLPDGMRINAGCGGGIDVDRSLYIPAKEKGTLFCVDMQGRTVRTFLVPDEEMIFETISCDGKDLWLSGTEKKIIKWSIDKKIKTEYDLRYLEDREIEMPWDSYFYVSRVFGEYVYYAPFKAKQLIRIHKQSGKIEQILVMDENEITLLLEVMNNNLYFNCQNVFGGMPLADYLIKENGVIYRENILVGEVECNRPLYEYNRDALKNFISQVIKGPC